MGTKLITAAVLGIALAMLAAPSKAETPDRIYVNGKVVTVDAFFSIKEALAVRGERIQAVGSTAELQELAGAHTEVIDLEGRTVIPGLIDSHVHFVRASRHWTMEVRLDDVQSRQEALARIKARADEEVEGAWILAIGGWVEDQFADNGGFTREELDAVAPQNPLFLQVIYNHAYLNSAAFERADIPVKIDPEEAAVAEPQADPPVHVDRDKDGNATGRIDGIGALIKVRSAIFNTVAEDVGLASTAEMARDFNKVGLTTIYDLGGGGTVPDSYVPARRLAELGKLPLRIRHGLWMTPNSPEDVDAAITRIQELRPFQGNGYFDLISIGEIVFNPLTDWPGFGPKTDSSHLEQFGRLVEAAAQNGWPIHVHAHYAATIAGFLDQIEKVNAVRPVKPLRWQIVHADFITAAEIERMKPLGMALSLNASSKQTGAVLAAMLGEKRRNMPPLRLIRDSGIRWAFGSDGTAAAEYNPFATLEWAVTGNGPDGVQVFDQMISREEALVAHTRDAAYLIFEENNLGSIEAGKLADFLILDRDYLSVNPEDIGQIKPITVVVGGNTVFSQ